MGWGRYNFNYETLQLYLDGISLDVDVYLTGILAGALIMLGLEKPRIKNFIVKLNKKEGVIRQGKKDPVQALLEVISKSRLVKYKGDQKIAVDQCKKAIQAVNNPDLNDGACKSPG